MLHNPNKHFADLIKQYSMLDILSDPDVILAKAGIGIPNLRNLMNDSQVETVWNTRLAGVTGAGFTIEPGDANPKARRAVNFVKEMVRNYDFPTIISAMMDAVAFGFCPVEIIWGTTAKMWRAVDFVPKPPEWFFFSQRKNLMFRSSVSASRVPENKFILIQNRPSYQNPYGVKLFSKVYWPVTFRRNGVRWWTMFIEKFGAPFIYGKFQKGASTEDRDDLLSALEDILANSVAVGPDDSYVEIKGDSIRSQSGQVHEAFYNAQNAEIAKAILGQTLTSDIGEHGSRAAAEVHYQVKADITKSDQRLVAGAFNKLFALVTQFNFGAEVPAPRFEFEQMEELHKERAERDKILYDMGARFNADYLSAHYQVDPAHIKVQLPSPTSPGGFQQFSRRENNETIFDFTGRLERQGQDTIDAIIDDFRKDISKARSFDDASNRILNRHKRQFKQRSKLVQILDNLRYVAASAGTSNAKK